MNHYGPALPLSPGGVGFCLIAQSGLKSLFPYLSHSALRLAPMEALNYLLCGREAWWALPEPRSLKSPWSARENQAQQQCAKWGVFLATGNRKNKSLRIKQTGVDLVTQQEVWMWAVGPALGFREPPVATAPGITSVLRAGRGTSGLSHIRIF